MININHIKSKWTHIITWSIFFVLMVAASSHILGLTNALFKSFFSVFIMALIFYLNYLVFLPKFLEKKRHLKYFITVLLSLITGVIISSYVDLWFFELDSFFKKGYILKEHLEHIPMHIIMGRNLVMNTVSILAILFLSTIFRGIVQRQKEDINKIELKNKIVEAESKFLKSQINPHFIFNALNNIYSLSQIQSPKTPEAIYKLSQILRYVIYDNTDKFVPIQKELEYITSFIDLQKMKDDEIGDNISIDINIQDKSIKIAPMLLIPFIENSFKHSYIEDTKNGWIEIKIESQKNKLLFSCKNSIPQTEFQKDKVGGIGLENVKKRLELLYPDNYKLKIDKEDSVFSVDLEITFK